MESVSLTAGPSQSPNFHLGKSYPGSCKPSITEVIGSRVQLRRAGKELVGLCPFHSEKNPSFSVSEDKGLFHCFGCGESGDVLDFVMKADGLTFPQALAELGMRSERAAARHTPERRAAEKVVSWANDQIQRMNARIRELDEMIELADEIPDNELAESLWRERRIVADLAEDITRAEYLEDFLELKDSIEKITETARGC
jgi:CHC2 zinc finger